MTGQRFHLAKNKEAFDVELLAAHRAMKAFLERHEAGTVYTISSDSTAAIERALPDRAGSGQASARAIIELEKPLAESVTMGPGSPGTMRWRTYT